MSIGATAAMGTAAQAADLTVTTTSDSGEGSLREKIEIANTTPLSNDRILFQSGLSGTIALEESLPSLLGPMEFEGPGMDTLRIDGDDQWSLLDSESDLTVSGLTFSNGSTAGGGGGINMNGADLTVSESRFTGGTASGGGGIALIHGDLTLTDSEITGNTASAGGGVAVRDSKVEISGSTISGNDVIQGLAPPQGGGIYLYLEPGTNSTIEDSVISGNTSPNAGGLFAHNGNLTIDSSLISRNTGTTAVGGAILGNPFGPQSNNRFTVTNSTIVDNDGPLAGAVVAASSGVSIESSTVTGNTTSELNIMVPVSSAAIVGFTPGIELDNTIVSGNEPRDLSTTPQNDEPPLVAGSIEGSFNLIGDRSEAQFTETVAGSNITSSAPQLGALADNGGPTQTMLPAETSPVVNKGASSLTSDARGLPRPVDFVGIPFSAAVGANGADIGAVELGYVAPPPPPPPPPPVVPSNAFSFGWVKLNKKKGVASLQVKVPGAGKVLVLGSKKVAKSSKAAKKAATVKVTIKAKGKAAKQLKKKGKAKVKARVRFTPTGGTARTKSKAVKLVKKKARKKK